MNDELDRRGAEAAADLLAEVTPSDTESMLASVRSGATTVGIAGPDSQRWPSTLLLAAAAAVVLILVGGLWLAVRDDADEIETVTTSAPTSLPTTTPPTPVEPTTPTTTPATEPTTTPSTTAPVIDPTTVPTTEPASTAPTTTVPVLPSGVDVDIQRVVLADGAIWAWGTSTEQNPGSNGHLLRMAPDGSTWTEIQGVDTSTLVSMAFADADDGWVVTALGLVSTHDGGATWTQVEGPTEVLSVAVVGDTAYAVAFEEDTGSGQTGFTVLASPTARDAFAPTGLTIPPSAAPVADFSFAGAGGTTWMTYNARVLADAYRSDGATWSAWDLSCENGPATVWSSGNVGEVLVDCDAGEWGAGVVTELRRSTDGGGTLTEVPLPPGDGASTWFDVRGVSTDGTIVAVSYGPAAPAVLLTRDLGVTWADPAWPFVPETLEIDGDTWVAAGRPAVDQPARLWTSTDAGATWTERVVTVAP